MTQELINKRVIEFGQRHFGGTYNKNRFIQQGIYEEAYKQALKDTHAPEMLEAIQMNIDKVELSQLDFFKKYGFNLGEIHERNKQLIIKATTI